MGILFLVIIIIFAFAVIQSSKNENSLRSELRLTYGDSTPIVTLITSNLCNNLGHMREFNLGGIYIEATERGLTFQQGRNVKYIPYEYIKDISWNNQIDWVQKTRVRDVVAFGSLGKNLSNEQKITYVLSLNYKNNAEESYKEANFLVDETFGYKLFKLIREKVS